MSLDQITIRPAEPRDASAVASVHDASWRGAYRGIIPGVALERMVERRGPAWWQRLIKQQRGIMVLEIHNKVVGYVTLGANRSPSLRLGGEIYEIYIAPAYQGLGFGSRLFAAAQERLHSAGLRDFAVWVLEDNDPAVAFYRAMGGEAVAQGVEHFASNDACGGQCRKLAFAWGVRARQAD